MGEGQSKAGVNHRLAHQTQFGKHTAVATGDMNVSDLKSLHGRCLPKGLKLEQKGPRSSTSGLPSGGSALNDLNKQQAPQAPAPSPVPVPAVGAPSKGQPGFHNAGGASPGAPPGALGAPAGFRNVGAGAPPGTAPGAGSHVFAPLPRSLSNVVTQPGLPRANSLVHASDQIPAVPPQGGSALFRQGGAAAPMPAVPRSDSLVREELWRDAVSRLAPQGKGGKFRAGSPSPPPPQRQATAAPAVIQRSDSWYMRQRALIAAAAPQSPLFASPAEALQAAAAPPATGNAMERSSSWYRNRASVQNFMTEQGSAQAWSQQSAQPVPQTSGSQLTAMPRDLNSSKRNSVIRFTSAPLQTEQAPSAAFGAFGGTVGSMRLPSGMQGNTIQTDKAAPGAGSVGLPMPAPLPAPTANSAPVGLPMRTQSTRYGPPANSQRSRPTVGRTVGYTARSPYAPRSPTMAPMSTSPRPAALSPTPAKREAVATARFSAANLKPAKVVSGSDQSPLDVCADRRPVLNDRE